MENMKYIISWKIIFKNRKGIIFMALRCESCRIEFKNDDMVVLDDFAILRHKKCYDYQKYCDLIDSIGKLENIRGKLPDFLMNAYREVIALQYKKLPEETSDDEVLSTIAYTLGYLE